MTSKDNKSPKYTVIIITGLPGVGKTKYIEGLIRDKPKLRKIILYETHRQIGERKKYLSDVPLVHWRGIKHLCPLLVYEETGDEEIDDKRFVIARMLQIGAPSRWICKFCQTWKLVSPDDCEHKKQFKTPVNLVLAPAVYLNSKYVRDYKPDIVIVDDTCMYKKVLPNLKKMDKYVRFLKFCKIWKYKTLLELFEDKNDPEAGKVVNLHNFRKFIFDTIERRLEYIVKGLIDPRIDDPDTAKIFLQIDPMDFVDWFRMYLIYGLRSKFVIPFFMPFFELTLKENRKVITVRLGLEEKFFDFMRIRFQREYGLPITFEHIKIEPDHPVAKSVVVCCKSPMWNPSRPAWMPMVSLKNPATRKAIKQRIGALIKSLPVYPKTIGIVTKKGVPMEDLVPTDYKGEIKTLHFGNLRGSNVLEDCDLCIVVSTYTKNIDTIEEDYFVYYRREPWTYDVINLPHGGIEYVDAHLEYFRRMSEDIERYHAIHCFRPINKVKTVYVFGKLPAEITKEFQTKNITFRKNLEGGIDVVDWKNFGQQMREKVDDKGVYQAELIKDLGMELGVKKEQIRRRIITFVEQHKTEYEIVDKTIGRRVFRYVQKR